MVRSRLSKRTERKTRKNLALSILGIILIVLLVFKFGIPLLVNLSLFLSGSQSNEETKIQSPTFIAPPVLDSFPQAIASADIIISGIASRKQKINLYINDNLVNTTITTDDGKFSFKEVVKPGENTIKAKTVVNEKESDFSNIITVILKNAPPYLNILSPSNGQSFSKDQNIINVQGTTDSNVKITVNDFRAITDNNGNFSYNISLQSGDNLIKISAIDTAGNKTAKEIKITYSP